MSAYWTPNESRVRRQAQTLLGFVGFCRLVSVPRSEQGAADYLKNDSTLICSKPQDLLHPKKSFSRAERLQDLDSGCGLLVTQLGCIETTPSQKWFWGLNICPIDPFPFLPVT
eukprot:c19403_g1_i2.p1 GENE.c19403_g1_i2~~c19403_g1_i2.p1  ORF type:complete len:113 (+),score=9.51 c19403_g1_i2:702-1040(+)